MFTKWIKKIKLQNKKVAKIGNSYKKNGRYYDKVEKTKAYKNCIKEVEMLAEIEAKEIAGGNVTKGYCHIYWACKKKILKEKYNIDWRSPAEMNPHCKFD